MTAPLPFTNDQLVDATDLNALITGLWPAVFTLPLSGNFTAYASGFAAPSYYRVGRNVHLSGLARPTAALPANSVIGTLPVGFRPSSTQLFVAFASDSFARIDVANTGTITITQAVPALGYVSLAGLAFPV